MTPEQASRLREAAKRLQSDSQDYWFAIHHKPEAFADASLLADHILATVPEDGDSTDEDKRIAELELELDETATRVSELEAELERTAAILQQHLPIGQVKAIGLLEVAAGVAELAQHCSFVGGTERDATNLEHAFGSMVVRDLTRAEACLAERDAEIARLEAQLDKLRCKVCNHRYGPYEVCPCDLMGGVVPEIWPTDIDPTPEKEEGL